MRYIKAEDILPREVIALIQEYADGVTIYIPRKAENRRAWGRGTAYRKELDTRNEHIRAEQAAGTPVPALAEKYHLSEKTIRRILRT
ncbi:MAG: hypothetical protein IJ001_10530 [Oscillospiraceae bacterium]|nr:hypothetical protein [Oscillospiraceae bacterium]